MTDREKLKITSVDDLWSDLQWYPISLEPAEWREGDRFTINELKEPTVAYKDEYNNLVCNGYYVRRGDPWAVACDVIKAERFILPDPSPIEKED